MHLLIVKFHSGLADKEVRENLRARLPLFREIPGLVQKYYAREAATGDYVGVYLFDSEAALLEYRASELAKTIPKVYEVEGKPRAEVLEMLFPLHEERERDLG